MVQCMYSMHGNSLSPSLSCCQMNLDCVLRESLILTCRRLLDVERTALVESIELHFSQAHPM